MAPAIKIMVFQGEKVDDNAAHQRHFKGSGNARGQVRATAGFSSE